MEVHAQPVGGRHAGPVGEEKRQLAVAHIPTDRTDVAGDGRRPAVRPEDPRCRQACAVVEHDAAHRIRGVAPADEIGHAHAEAHLGAVIARRVRQRGVQHEPAHARRPVVAADRRERAGHLGPVAPPAVPQPRQLVIGAKAVEHSEPVEPVERVGKHDVGRHGVAARRIALDDAHPSARPGQLQRERRPGAPGADHDGVEGAAHGHNAAGCGLSMRRTRVDDGLEYRILGPVEVWSGNQEIDVGGRKARTLLAVLLLHANDLVSADQLADDLWDDAPPASAARDAAHPRVASAVPAERRFGRGGGVAPFHPGVRVRPQGGRRPAGRRPVPGVWSIGARLCWATVTRRRPPPPCRDALGLWRGPVLGELNGAHFAMAEAARLDEHRLSAIDTMLRAELASGRHATIVGELEQLVAQHPLRETLTGHLMVALYRCGRQADSARRIRRHPPAPSRRTRAGTVTRAAELGVGGPAAGSDAGRSGSGVRSVGRDPPLGPGVARSQPAGAAVRTRRGAGPAARVVRRGGAGRSPGRARVGGGGRGQDATGRRGRRCRIRTRSAGARRTVRSGSAGGIPTRGRGAPIPRAEPGRRPRPRRPDRRDRRRRPLGVRTSAIASGCSRRSTSCSAGSPPPRPWSSCSTTCSGPMRPRCCCSTTSCARPGPVPSSSSGCSARRRTTRCWPGRWPICAAAGAASMSPSQHSDRTGSPHWSRIGWGSHRRRASCGLCCS